MLYFIPAWYENNQWCEHEQCWQERRMHTEFDDTVKHIQLFHRKHPHPYQILLLSYAPNFRHFLHRQSVYHAPYWSCFDAIQEIQREKTMVLSFHNLTWPEDIEYLHTPYVVVAMRKGVKYAQVEFGEDGNMIRIEMYKGNQVYRRNIYDDRGFVSSTILYENGEPVYQDYLMENGEWKLRHFLREGRVEVNPKHPDYLLSFPDEKMKNRFSQLQYDSLEQVIQEVFAAYAEHTPSSAAFCIAMHEQHAKLLQNVLTGKRKTVLSFYLDRYEPEKHPETLQMMRKADYIITDSKEASGRIIGMDGRLSSKITDITPYDTRVDLGISQQLSVQKILVPVDGLSENMLSQLILCFGKYLPTNDRVRIHLFTRDAGYERPRYLLQYVKTQLNEGGMREDWVSVADETKDEMNLLEEESPLRFFVEQCVDELSVSKCMREQRVIVDMRKHPELYLQISAISMGIPQIVCTRTQFVEDRKNGLIIKKVSSLPKALDFYLGGLANWNQAVVASYELGQKFSTNVLIEKWKEVIAGVVDENVKN